jgi:hypothetical protein
MNSVPQLSTICHQLAQCQRPDYEATNRFLIKARREVANSRSNNEHDSCNQLAQIAAFLCGGNRSCSFSRLQPKIAFRGNPPQNMGASSV